MCYLRRKTNIRFNGGSDNDNTIAIDFVVSVPIPKYMSEGIRITTRYLHDVWSNHTLFLH